MILGELFPGAVSGQDAWIPVTGLTADSRAVEPGRVFFAISGTKADGLSYVAAALTAGAVAVVAEAARPSGFPNSIPFIRVPDARRALAVAASLAHPLQPSTVLAVTGTSGKTSVADFTRQILMSCGRQAASLGTIGVIAPSGAHYGTLTTPDPITLHDMLETLAQDGVTHLAMEASSHGLDQRRLDGVRLTAGAFTNLGRDHLDYHPTLEDYLKAKLRLFEALLPDGAPAVINADGAHAKEVIEACKGRGLKVMTVGRAGKHLRLASLVQDGFGQAMIVEAEGRRFDVHLPLAGDFQAANALVAGGLALAAGEELSRVLAALSRLTGVKGRMEKVGELYGAPIIVDYAHKPDALAHVLDTLRPYASGRLICVFGCGGDRDTGKRPMMGAIAAEKADLVIVTDDNPRSEDAASIRASILAAAPGAREIGDRALAIRTAVRDLRMGDVLVVAGKGHETGQIIGNRVFPFSDHDAVQAALSEVTH